MLFSRGEAPPKQVVAHGWWTAEGKKMSKSLGNVIDIEKIRSVAEKHSLDAVRYYLLRAAPFGTDLDWSEADFAKSYTELGNVTGNLLNRGLNMVGKYRNGELPSGRATEQIDRDLQAKIDALPGQLSEAYRTLTLQHAAMLPVELARAANGYIDATAPFKLAKDPAQAARLDTVLNLATQAIYRTLVGLLPILPVKAAEGLSQLGVDVSGKTLGQLFAEPLPAGHKLGEGKPLFPRIEQAK